MNNIILKELEELKLKKIYILEEDLFHDKSIKNFFKDFEWVYINPELNISIKDDGFILVKKENNHIVDFLNENKNHLIIYISYGLLQLNTDKSRISKNSYILSKEKSFNLRNKNPFLSELINNYKFKASNTKLSKEIIENIIKNKVSYSFSSSETKINIEIENIENNILIKDDSENENMVEYVKKVIEENKNGNIYYLFDKRRLENKKELSSEIRKLISNIIETEQNSIELLKYFSKIYTTNDFIGLEALMMNKEVYCLEESFYSGLGLTKDLYQTISIKEKKISIEKLVYILYELLSIYKKRKTGDFIPSIELINFFEEIKNDQKIICLFNFPIELQVSMKGFFYHIHKLYFFDKGTQDIIENQLHKQNKTIEIIIWEDKKYPDLERFSKDKNVRILRVNKGPLKTVHKKKDDFFYSLYFDNKSLVVDSVSLTEMEEIFNSFQKEDHQLELEEAKKYLEIFNNNNISKINGLKEIDFEHEFSINHDDDNILIIGQDFDNDISVKYSGISSNLELVKQISAENPNSKIFFKLDYVKIFDKEKCKKEYLEILNYARIIDEKVSISSLYSSINRFYTVSSILGLEAILRNKSVYCLGLPFYAGWGLSHDRMSKKIRTNKLTVEEMFYISYIFYPRYINKNMLEHSDFLSVMNDIIKQKNNVKIDLKPEILKEDLIPHKKKKEKTEKSFFSKILDIFSSKKENKELKEKIKELEDKLSKK